MAERNGLNHGAKACPYCQVPLRADGGAFELVRRGASTPDSHTGIPVSSYSCPKCGRLELYNLRVTATI